MARRSSKEIWELVHKRLDAFEVLDEKRLQDHPGSIPWEGRENYLADMKRIGATPSQILRGVEEGLADCTFHFLETEPEVVAEQKETLAFYRERTGRHLFDDVPDPRLKLRAVLERGRVKSEEEWRLLEETLSEVEQTLFAKDEVPVINKMLAAFEAKLARRK